MKSIKMKKTSTTNILAKIFKKNPGTKAKKKVANKVIKKPKSKVVKKDISKAKPKSKVISLFFSSANLSGSIDVRFLIKVDLP